jgi:hypothetical protein
VILRAAKIAIADEHTMAAELDKPAPANVFFFFAIQFYTQIRVLGI